MKKNLLLIIFLTAFSNSFSQVPKRVIVEHFTNSKCSICANRNPGFYSNVFSQPDILHLSYYPSSPYAGCFFSMQNATENDARTNYYGVYGGTPRLVIEGVVIPNAANYSDTTIFSPFTGQTSPIEIHIKMSTVSTDSLKVSISIIAAAANSIGDAKLYSAIAEDTINYTGSNGEPVHYNVFHQALSGIAGQTFTIPSITGDSIVIEKTILINALWDENKLSAFAIVQSLTDKSVIQAQKNSTIVNDINMNVSSTKKNSFNIFPNPVAENIIISTGEMLPAIVEIYDLAGKKILAYQLFSAKQIVDIRSINSGMYLISVNKSVPQKFIKQ